MEKEIKEDPRDRMTEEPRDRMAEANNFLQRAREHEEFLFRDAQERFPDYSDEEYVYYSEEEYVEQTEEDLEAEKKKEKKAAPTKKLLESCYAGGDCDAPCQYGALDCGCNCGIHTQIVMIFYSRLQRQSVNSPMQNPEPLYKATFRFQSHGSSWPLKPLIYMVCDRPYKSHKNDQAYNAAIAAMRAWTNREVQATFLDVAFEEDLKVLQERYRNDQLCCEFFIVSDDGEYISDDLEELLWKTNLKYHWGAGSIPVEDIPLAGVKNCLDEIWADPERLPRLDEVLEKVDEQYNKKMFEKPPLYWDFKEQKVSQMRAKVMEKHASALKTHKEIQDRTDIRKAEFDAARVMGMPVRLYRMVQRAEEICPPSEWSEDLLTELAEHHREIQAEFKRKWAETPRYLAIRAKVAGEHNPKRRRIEAMPQPMREMPDDIEVLLHGKCLQAYQLLKRERRGEDVAKEQKEFDGYKTYLRLAFKIAQKEGVLPRAEMHGGLDKAYKWWRRITLCFRKCDPASLAEGDEWKPALQAGGFAFGMMHLMSEGVTDAIAMPFEKAKAFAVNSAETLEQLKGNAGKLLLAFGESKPVQALTSIVKFVASLFEAAVAAMSNSKVFLVRAVLQLYDACKSVGTHVFGAAVKLMNMWTTKEQKEKTDEVVAEMPDLTEARAVEVRAWNKIIQELPFMMKRLIVETDGEAYKSAMGKVDYRPARKIELEQVNEYNVDDAVCYALRSRAEKVEQHGADGSWISGIWELVKSLVQPNVAHDSNKLKNILYNLNSLFTFGNHVKNVISHVVGGLKAFLGFVTYYVFGIRLFGEEEQKWTDWTATAVALNRQITENQFDQDFLEKTKTAVSQYMEMLPTMAGLQIADQRAATLLYTRMNTALLEQSFPEGDAAEAVFLLIGGRAGLGKSTFMGVVAEALAHGYGQKPVPWRTGDEFNDQYRKNRNKVVTLDDIAVKKEEVERAQEWADIIHLVSGAGKLPVNQAFTKSQTLFEAAFIIGTTNLDKLSEAGLTSWQAAARRTQLVEVETLAEARDGEGWKMVDGDLDKTFTVHFVTRERLHLGKDQRVFDVKEVQPFSSLALKAHAKIGKTAGDYMKPSEFIVVCKEMAALAQQFKGENALAAVKLLEHVKQAEVKLQQTQEKKERELTPKGDEAKATVTPQEQEKGSVPPVATQHGGGMPDVQDLVAAAVDGRLDNYDAAVRRAWINHIAPHMPHLDREVLAKSPKMFETWVKQMIRDHKIRVEAALPSSVLREGLIYFLEILGGAIFGVTVALGITSALKYFGFMSDGKEKAVPAEQQAYNEELARAVKRNVGVPVKLEQHGSEHLQGAAARIALQTMTARFGFSGETYVGSVIMIAQNVGLTARHLVQNGKVFCDAIALANQAGQNVEIIKTRLQNDFTIMVPERPDLDYAFILVKEGVLPIQGIRNLESYFMTREELSKLRVTSLKMVRNTGVMMEDLPQARIHEGVFDVVVKDELCHFSNIVEYKARTQKGDSGTPVCIDSTQTQATLVGPHVMGNETTGYAVIVTQDAVKLALGAVRTTVEQHGRPWEFPELRDCEKPDYVPNEVRVLGRFENALHATLPRKTAIQPSIIAEDLKWESRLAPAILAPVGKALYPMREGIKRMCHPERQDFRACWEFTDALNYAKMLGPPVLGRRVGDKMPHVITAEEAVEGIPGVVKSADLTRSSGWPLNKLKRAEGLKNQNKGDFLVNNKGEKDYSVLQNYFEHLRYKGGGQKVQIFAVAASLKDETRPLIGGRFAFEKLKDMELFLRDAPHRGIVVVDEAKAREYALAEGTVLEDKPAEFLVWVIMPKKTRLFYTVHGHQMLADKMLFQTFCLALKDRRIYNGTGVGFTPNKRQDVERLVSHLASCVGGRREMLKLLSYDLKSNDLTLYTSWKKWLAQTVALWYHMHFALTELQVEDIYLAVLRDLHPLLLVDGMLVDYSGIFPSGLFGTFELGSVVNSYKLDRFLHAAMRSQNQDIELVWIMKHVPRMVSGDDVLAGMPERISNFITPRQVQREAAIMGFYLTSATVHKDPNLGDNFDTFETARTVKRTFRFEENLAFMPLDKVSLLGNLAWQREKGDPLLLAASAMRSALGEAFLHGAEFYAEVSTEFARIAAKHRLDLAIPSYVSLMKAYVQ
jgi:hypothetical protein